MTSLEKIDILLYLAIGKEKEDERARKVKWRVRDPAPRS